MTCLERCPLGRWARKVYFSRTNGRDFSRALSQVSHTKEFDHKECLVPHELITELKQRRQRRQRERQKCTGFRLAKQQLCTCIKLLCTFLNRLCTTTTWKCLISRFLEDPNLSWTLIQSLTIQLQLRINFANIWRIKRDGISAIKFEAARIDFLSDVFVAVAVVVAKINEGDFKDYQGLEKGLYNLRVFKKRMNPVPSGRNLINFSQLNEKISSYELAHTHGRHNRGCPHKTPLLMSVLVKAPGFYLLIDLS